MRPLLRELLDLGLVDIGEDDARYDYLEKASGKLAQHYLKNPTDAIPAVLISLDDGAGEDEPCFQHAETVLREDWKALRSRFRERPRPLLRILLFDALNRAGEQSSTLAATQWLAAASIYPHLRLGREGGVFRRVLIGYAERLEHQATWQGASVEEDVPPASDTLGLPPEKAKVIRDSEFLPLIAASLGNSSPVASVSPSPFSRAHWPNNNGEANPNMPGSNPIQHAQFQNWVHAIAPRLDEVLTAVVNTGSQRLAAELSKSVSILKQTLSSASQQRQAASLQTDVLWWLESLYSPSLHTSYRTLGPQLAVVAMAHDLSTLVRAHIPTSASVAWVLGEAVNRLKDAGYDNKFSLRETLRQLQKPGDGLRGLVKPPGEAEGRRQLLHIIEATIHNSAPSAGQLKAQTGLSGDEEVTLPELAMWCFRDLQAHDLCHRERA